MSYTVNDVHVHTGDEWRAALRQASLSGLAQAWRWLEQNASQDEADEMVVWALDEMQESPELIEKVIDQALSWDPAGDDKCARCGEPWSRHTLETMPPKHEKCEGFECSKDHDADGSECPLDSASR